MLFATYKHCSLDTRYIPKLTRENDIKVGLKDTVHEGAGVPIYSLYIRLHAVAGLSNTFKIMLCYLS